MAAISNGVPTNSRNHRSISQASKNKMAGFIHVHGDSLRLSSMPIVMYYRLFFQSSTITLISVRNRSCNARVGRVARFGLTPLFLSAVRRGRRGYQTDWPLLNRLGPYYWLRVSRPEVGNDRIENVIARKRERRKASRSPEFAPVGHDLRITTDRKNDRWQPLTIFQSLTGLTIHF